MEKKIDDLLSWLEDQRREQKWLAKLAFTKRTKALFAGEDFAYERVIEYVKKEFGNDEKSTDSN